MRFRIKEMTVKDKEFHLTFQKEDDEHIVLAHVDFESPWKHAPFDLEGNILFLNEEGKEQAKTLFEGFDMFGEVPAVRRSEIVETINNMTQSSFLSIPNETNREIFFMSLATWAKQAQAPLEVHTADHPGYPLLVIVSNSFVMSAEHISEIIHVIKRAILHMEITLQPHPNAGNSVPEEDEADFENAEVFEAQIDPEVRALTEGRHHEMQYEEMEDMAGGEVVPGESEQTEEIAAAVETPTWGFEIELPYNKLYSVRREWQVLWAAQTQKSLEEAQEIFQYIPTEWLSENRYLQSRWCFPTPLAAFRTLVGKHAQEYSEEELQKQYPNCMDFVYEVELEDSKCIIESEKYGFLIVKP